jgi:hypothetical protein
MAGLSRLSPLSSSASAASFLAQRAVSIPSIAVLLLVPSVSKVFAFVWQRLWFKLELFQSPWELWQKTAPPFPLLN